MPERHTGMAVLPSILVVGLLAALILMAVRTILYAWRRSRLLALTERVTRSHVKMLTVKQKQLVLHDGYGNHDVSGWIAHVNYFIDSVILREARAQGIKLDGTAKGETLRADMTRRFLAVVNLAAPTLGERAPRDDQPVVTSGQRYEAQCHNLLQSSGWIVAMTPVTGDQGADLIADLGGRRVVLQCKFHARPIGNKAVQEAYTARNLHGADHAVVVSNTSFTRSAVELARANDVLLVHHDLLPDLERLIGQTRSNPPVRIFDRNHSP